MLKEAHFKWSSRLNTPTWKEHITQLQCSVHNYSVQIQWIPTSSSHAVSAQLVLEKLEDIILWNTDCGSE